MTGKEAGKTDFEERSHLVQQLMADLEQAVGEVDAALKDSIDELRSDAPGKKETRRELAQQIVIGAPAKRGTTPLPKAHAGRNVAFHRRATSRRATSLPTAPVPAVWPGHDEKA